MKEGGCCRCGVLSGCNVACSTLSAQEETLFLGWGGHRHGGFLEKDKKEEVSCERGGGEGGSKVRATAESCSSSLP